LTASCLKTLIKRIAHSLGVAVVTAGHSAARYLDHPPRSALDEALLRGFERLDALNFIQIGANDGLRADPIHDLVVRYGWSGLLVEPLPRHFARLALLHAGNPRLDLLNAAVDEATGTRAIFQIRPDQPGLPDWAHGLASFSEERLHEAARGLHLPPGSVVSETIATVTWNEIRARFGPRQCDVLVVDVEGYDVTLLRLADLPMLRPRVIQFEHICISRAERIAFYGELLDLGYEIATDGPDTVASLPRSTG
jgi:FkbM family methyltransferase